MGLLREGMNQGADGSLRPEEVAFFRANPGIPYVLRADGSPVRNPYLDQSAPMNKSEAWTREFGMEHGEMPVISGSDYDYARALQGGVQPGRSAKDGRYHWPSKLGPGEGEWLKGEGHPTRWKEDYMQVTGQEPEGTKSEQLMLEAFKRAQTTSR